VKSLFSSLLLIFFIMIGLPMFMLGQTTYNVSVGPGGTISYGNGDLTINAGDTVVWTWMTMTHSVTSGTCSPGGGYYGSSCSADGNFDSGDRSAGATFSVVFNTPGSYPYYCDIHLSAMVGRIVVNAAPAIAFSTNALSFTSINVGYASTNQTVTFSNSGSTSLSMSSLAITGDFSQTNNCADPLPAKQNCTITITFTPSTTGTRTGALTYPNATSVQLTGSILNPSINPTRPTRPRPPSDSSSSAIFSPMNVLLAVVGILLLAKFTFVNS